MQIKTIKVGEIQTNCYIVIDEKSNEALVIDPGDEPDKILPEIKGLKVKSIIITHGHWDHVGAVDEVNLATGVPVYMHAGDSMMAQADKDINDGDEFKIGKTVFKVIHTPGHSPGGICLYTKGYLFSGDTLFLRWHGRVDLPGSSAQKMKQSLKKLAELPDDTKVYPGHDESTTIGREKERGALA
jgi:glyoxylase-like metal-dependent hydrolase (beta-lactamase superfamily II)